MKLPIIKLASVAGLGLAIAACQPHAEDEEIKAAADDLFAPVAVSSNKAENATFPPQLSNTEVAVKENQGQNSVSTSETAVDTVLTENSADNTVSATQDQSQSQSQSATVQQSTQLREIPAPVFVRPAESNSIMTRSAQSMPVVTHKASDLSCAAPTSKAALAAYAAHCTNSIQRPSVETTETTETTVTTAPTKITTTTTAHVIGDEPKVTRVVETFAPVDISCSEAPTTKAALAAYRANCLKRVGAPVRLSHEQTYVRPTSSTSTVSNITPEEETSAASVGMETNNSNTPDEASPDLPPVSSESIEESIEESIDNAAFSTTVEEEIEESPIAPSGSALFDCSKDPSTGAELALYRAYCQG